MNAVKRCIVSFESLVAWTIAQPSYVFQQRCVFGPESSYGYVTESLYRP